MNGSVRSRRGAQRIVEANKEAQLVLQFERLLFNAPRLGGAIKLDDCSNNAAKEALIN